MTDSFFDTATDLRKIRIEQARLLKERAIGSAITVQFFVILFALLIWICVSSSDALLWLGLASFMVLVTVLYAKLMAPNGITEDTVEPYLFGHVIICGLIGLLWGGYAIHILNFSSLATLVVAFAMPMTLTVGGMLPSSAYRRGYMALATCALLPFAVNYLLEAPGELRYFGVGFLAYFGLTIVSSAQAEINTRDGIIARTTQNLTKKLIAKNEEVERIHNEKTQFLAATSHDFSQPLHAQGYFIQALRPVLTTEPQKHLLDKIEVSWKAQSELLHGLAEITRLDSGAIIPKPTPFNVKTALENTLSAFEEDISKKSITLSTDLNTVFVHSDPLLFGRIMTNLISNAVKYVDTGGHISLVAKTENDQALITLQDNGPGIASVEQKRVFEEYFQLEADTDKPGLGLGLAIVKRLTDLLGLDLTLVSEDGGGTHFSIKLPLSGRVPPSDTLPQKQSTHFSGNPLVVLIDDEAAIRESMSTLLTSWGLRLISAANGKEATTLLSQTLDIPSVLIVDKRLSRQENGFDLIRLLREEVNEDIPAILMTGNVAGFDDLSTEDNIHFMIKPASPDDVKSVIEQILLA